MYKYLLGLLAFLTFFGIEKVNAQLQTSSPYSRFGIGVMEAPQNVRSRGMGGLSIAINSPYEVNPINPASYTAFDSLSFVFDGGFEGQLSTYKSTEGSVQDNSGSISYLTIGIPVNRWWRTSLGLYPFSTVGYDVYSLDENTNMGDILYLYNGGGGTSVAYWGNAFKVGKNLSLGFNAEYIFGNITRQGMVAFLDSTNVWNTRRTEKYHLEDFNFTLGAQYVTKLNENDKLTFGVVFGNQNGLDATSDRYVETFFGGLNGNVEYNNDTVFEVEKESGEITMPLEFGFGVAWEKPEKLLVGADFKWGKWSDFKVFGKNGNFTDSYHATLGCEFIPNSSSISSYLNRMSYRLGINFFQQGLQVADHTLQELSGTIGFGFPMPRSRSQINIALQIGQRGTTNSNLVQENFFNLSVGISLAEFWFMKRRYK